MEIISSWDVGIENWQQTNACREVLEGLEMCVDFGSWEINEGSGRAQQGIAKQKPELVGGKRIEVGGEVTHPC